MPIIPLNTSHKEPVSRVGGKAHALGRLIAFGAPVPPGFVIPPGPLDEAAVLKAFDKLGAKYVAVRSSAAGEDAGSQSWAGQFESYLYVSRDQLLERVAECRLSGTSARAKAYDASSQGMAVAVVVQAMVASDVAGVLFTVNPVTKADQVVIEAVFGLGEQLVQGLATPDNYVFDKSSGDITQTISLKLTRLVGSPGGVVEQPVDTADQDRPALSHEQCRELAKLSTQLERSFGYPLDIEFAYAGARLYIVQARPITTI
ncbi:MAG: phosphoenolpyruvate synthase [Candidatus Saccharibacteria bacterium]|nr:phosphoenolpyruvate synthase [Candidatus Saccharibacteria bacterium]